MTFTLKLDGTLQSVRAGSLSITKDTSGSMSTAQFTIPVNLDTGTPPEAGQVVLIESGATAIFGGQIVRVEPTPNHGGVIRVVDYVCSCQDYTLLLDGAVAVSESYTTQNDSAVIADLFATYLPSVSTALVTTIESLASVAFDGVSLRAAMDQISKLTGAAWYVDPAKNLRYYTPGTVAASFSLSDTPNETTSFGYKLKPKFITEFTAPANKVTVFGKIGSGGVVVTYTAEDAASQALYGVRTRAVVDRNIQTIGEAQLRAEYEIAQYANPRASGSLTFTHDGLDVGQSIAVVCASSGIDASYIVNRLTIRQLTNDITEYTADLGQYRANLEEIIRRMAELSKGAAYTPVALPAVGTVTNSSLGSNLGLVFIGNALPSLPDVNYPADCVFFLTTDRKVYRRSANTWTTSVFNADIDRLSADKLVVVNADIQSLAATKITAGSLASDVINTGNLSASNIVSGTVKVGGGTGKPGLLEVYDGTPAVIGKIGDLGGSDYGVWARNAWFGGTGTANAKIRCKANGDVEIDGSVIIGAVASATDATNATAVPATGVTAGTFGAGVLYTNNLAVDYITGWAGATIAVGAGLTFSATGSVNTSISTLGVITPYVYSPSIDCTQGGTYNGVNIAGNAGIFIGTEATRPLCITNSRVAHLASLNIGTYGSSTEVIDSSRIANFVSLNVGGTEVIDSSRNVNGTTLKVGGTEVVSAALELKGRHVLRSFSGANFTTEVPAYTSLTDHELIEYYDNGGTGMHLILRSGANRFEVALASM